MPEMPNKIMIGRTVYVKEHELEHEVLTIEEVRPRYFQGNSSRLELVLKGAHHDGMVVTKFRPGDKIKIRRV